MSVREVTSRLNTVKTELPRLAEFGRQAEATLAEAAALVNAVLDDVQDKALAGDIAGHGPSVTAAFTSAQTAIPDLDATIRQFRTIGSR